MAKRVVSRVIRFQWMLQVIESQLGLLVIVVFILKKVVLEFMNMMVLVVGLGKAFNMPNLSDVFQRKDKGYKRNIHYKTFVCSKMSNGHLLTNGKQLFITYKGMLKILFSGRSDTADKFVDWATSTLFTVQMGTREQKETLGSKLLGVPGESLRSVLSKSSCSVPCIYMFSLGVVKDLRKIMNIPESMSDDQIIIKYGLTKDLHRRTSEHMAEYEKIPGVKINCMCYSFIDTKYLSQAENDMKGFFENYEQKFDYKNYNELISIKPNRIKYIQRYFDGVRKEYSGSIAELNNKVDVLKQKISEQKKR